MTGVRRSVTLHVMLVTAAFGVGVALRAAHLGAPALSFDEFFHAFAARSLLEGHGLALPTGEPYTRTRLVTFLTAAAFALFGEGEAEARLPSLVFGVLTLPLAYVAGRMLFGRTAGLVALVLLALSPDAIDVSRFARLYAPLTFFVLLAALAAFRGIEGRRGETADVGPRLTGRRVGWLALAAAAGAVALHLHPVALGLGVVVQVYCAAMAIACRLARRAGAGRYASLALLIVAPEAVGAALPGVRHGFVDAVLTPLPWYLAAPGTVGNNHYYLAAQYAWLWFLVWPATAVALLAWPRAGLYVALAFWLQIAFISVAVATKQPRYILHLLPFAWLLLAAAAAALWPAARTAAVLRLEPFRPRWVPVGAVAAALVAVVLLPLARQSPSVVAAVRRPAQLTGSYATGAFYEWRGLARVIGPLPARAEVVSSIPLAAPYYLARPGHWLVERFHRRQPGDGAVQSPAELATLRARGAPLWVIVERWRWDEPGQIDDGIKHMVLSDCGAIPVPKTMAFAVFDCGIAPAPPASDRAGGRAPAIGR